MPALNRAIKATIQPMPEYSTLKVVNIAPAAAINRKEVVSCLISIIYSHELKAHPSITPTVAPVAADMHRRQAVPSVTRHPALQAMLRAATAHEAIPWLLKQSLRAPQFIP